MSNTKPENQDIEWIVAHMLGLASALLQGSTSQDVDNNNMTFFSSQHHSIWPFFFFLALGSFSLQHMVPNGDWILSHSGNWTGAVSGSLRSRYIRSGEI
jgi:hypothetical protein